MNILLLAPINRSYVVMPSLGLGYLAAVLVAKGHTVRILDSKKESLSYEGFSEFIQKEHFDVIGLQVYSYDLNSVKKHLSIIRNNSPGTITVAGGPHPTGDPTGTLHYLEDLDFAFQGEAEIGLPMLIAHLESGTCELADIPGLIWKNGVAITLNPKQTVKDLDALPLPAWDLMSPETYPEAPHGAFTRQFPTAPIIITRGCPCRCTFCAGPAISGHTIRWRSLDNVITELRILKKRGIREFHIEDENFTLSRPFVLEFCERIAAANLGMSWSLPSGIRLDTVDHEMLLAMAKAGCYSLAVGIEFGTDRILQKTHKGLSLKLIRKKMQLFAGSGIKVTGFFLFGIPGETLEEMEQTVMLALELPLDRAQFNIFGPLPGSIEWDQLKKRGALDTLDWDRLFVHDVAYVEAGMTREELKGIQRRAVLRFYLRPRILFGLLSEIRSFRHLTFLLRRLVDSIG